MEFRRLGKSGLVVSVVGLGTNNFGMKLDLEQSRAVAHAALDAGITLFDTADSYGTSEERVGEFLQGVRDNVIIATKVGSDTRRRGIDNGEDWDARGSRRYVRRAVESSLRRLRTDWIDLLQLHRPDPLTPIEETLDVLSDLVREGKVRYIGQSNFSGFETAHAEWTSRTSGHQRFVSAQNEYNWLNRSVEQELFPALQEYGIGFLPYFPLASGLLTGKYKRGQQPPEGSRVVAFGLQSHLTDRAFDVIEKLEAFAAERSVTLMDIAIGGLAAQPAVSSVIAGATSPEQIAANVKAGAWQPSAEELATIREITAAS